jgi:hypothetical protein
VDLPADYDRPPMPAVRVADCGCVLDADTPPVGYRFATTSFGDKRLAVYSCKPHYHPRPVEPPDPEPARKPSRTRKGGRLSSRSR